MSIITRTEIRMADEIDAGQERGEISTGGRPDETVQTADSLGLDRRRVSEWRKTRDRGVEAATIIVDRIILATRDTRDPEETYEGD